MVRVSKFFSFWSSFLFLLGAFILYGCGVWNSSTGPSGDSLVKLAIVPPKMYAVRALSEASVTTITVTISASDITTITKTKTEPPWEWEISVKSGSNRKVDVAAYDSLDLSTNYFGTETVNLTAGETKNLTITLFLNNAPVISSLSLGGDTLPASGSVTMTCVATDVDNDTLTYTWSLNPSTGKGSISQDGTEEATYEGGGPSASGALTVTCAVSDSKGGTATKSVSTTATTAAAAEVAEVDDTPGPLLGGKLKENRFRLRHPIPRIVK